MDDLDKENGLPIHSLILLLFFPFLLLAQEQDFQLWTKVGLSHSLNKTVKLSFDQGYRLRENAALSDALFSNLSIRDFDGKFTIFSSIYLIKDLLCTLRSMIISRCNSPIPDIIV
ncbi:DUF2490 domain-containing protein [bacterium]|nr:DUF2490 domain-containing protein [bacterium]